MTISVIMDGSRTVQGRDEKRINIFVGKLVTKLSEAYSGNFKGCDVTA